MSESLKSHQTKAYTQTEQRKGIIDCILALVEGTKCGASSLFVGFFISTDLYRRMVTSTDLLLGSC